MNNPKLPLLNAEYMLIARQQKNNGYTTKNGTLGTVAAKVTTTMMFRNQLKTSKHNLTGWLCQSFFIKLTVLCQSIKPCDQQFLRCLSEFRGQR
jgi:hypothetical protein